jgi:hypothetical protein
VLQPVVAVSAEALLGRAAAQQVGGQVIDAGQRVVVGARQVVAEQPEDLLDLRGVVSFMVRLTLSDRRALRGGTARVGAAP